MSETPLTNGQWVRSAVGRYERRLTAYAAHLLGDADRARDVVQETFCRLCRQDRRAVEDHLAEWLFTVCRHRAFDVKRKERRMRPLSEARIDAHPSPRIGPPDRAERNEAASRVAGAVDALPPNQREVVRLKFQHGLSYKQISAVTGLTVSNVGFLLHTAIQTLRQEMTPPI